MPQATNIIVNNAAAVAKTFTLGSPASDSNVAWWELKEGLNKLAFPRLTLMAKPTGDQARRQTFKMAFPSTYTDTTTGLMKVGKVAYFEVTSKIPDEFPEAMKADFAAYAKNLLAHILVNEVVRDATSAT